MKQEKGRREETFMNTLVRQVFSVTSRNCRTTVEGTIQRTTEALDLRLFRISNMKSLQNKQPNFIKLSELKFLTISVLGESVKFCLECDKC